MSRRLEASDLVDLARRMKAASSGDPKLPLFLTADDIAALGPENEARFWELVRLARLRSLDS